MIRTVPNHILLNAFRPRTPRAAAPRSLRRRALSMVESVVSVALVSLLLVAALDALGASKTSQRLSAEKRLGTALAQDLLDEIMHVSYLSSGSSATKVLGIDLDPIIALPGSCTPPVRACFDELHDYIGWEESPPQQRDGTEMTEFTGWSRTVNVEHIKIKDFNSIASMESGYMRVFVEARYEGRLIAKATALRVSALPLASEMP
ncbi:MAG: hypothetical protein J5J06_17030 [Phycisphaerae bacterium]|nr:hypothetical protein [Phycisphaerae bacterium]